MSGWRRRVSRGLGSLASTYVLICVAMFVAQRWLLFHATSIPDDEHARLAARADVEVLEVEVRGAKLSGFFLAGRGEGPRPTILYFGGNAQSVWRQVDAKGWAAKLGFNLVFVAYRGYDRSTGEPSGEAITADALAVYDAVVPRPEVDPARVLTWGFSLGTGAAAHVACNRAVAGVILMAPYDTLGSVAAAQYPFLPVRALFRHEIDTLACAARAESPALIMHGDQDSTIAPSHGEAVAEAWGGTSRWVLLEGVGHNDISNHADVRPALTDFLAR